MVTLGMLMSFARAEPGAADALTARPGVLRRSLAVLPARLVPTRTRRRRPPVIGR
jgi:cell division protein FtsW